MSNNINLDYAKSWFVSKFPKERLIKIYEYNNCYIYDSVPKGMENKYGQIIRSAVGLDKKTGKHFTYNPMQYDTEGNVKIHIIDNIDDYYVKVGKEFIHNTSKRR